jgi:toxin FitB
VLPLDAGCTQACAELMAKARALGLATSSADSYIAAIAAAHGFLVATRDVRAFAAAGAGVINPWVG